MMYFANSDDSGPTIEEVVDPPSSSLNSNSKTGDQVELKGKQIVNRRGFTPIDAIFGGCLPVYHPQINSIIKFFG